MSYGAFRPKLSRIISLYQITHKVNEKTQIDANSHLFAPSGRSLKDNFSFAHLCELKILISSEDINTDVPFTDVWAFMKKQWKRG